MDSAAIYNHTRQNSDAYVKYNGKQTLFSISENPTSQIGYGSGPDSSQNRNVGELPQPANRPDNVWGTIELPVYGKVTIYNGGVTSYDGGQNSALTTDIDWDNLNSPEERAAALIEQFGGTLTMAGTAEKSGVVHQETYADFLKNIMDDDGLIDTFFGKAMEGRSVQELIESSNP